MNKKSGSNIIWWLLLLPLSSYAEQDPCRGPGMLLSLINRPSFSDSACTVPPKNLLLEGGFQNLHFIEGVTQINTPLLNIRTGLTNDSEFIINPSNSIHQTVFPFSGITPTWMGLKYRFHHTQDWIITGEVSFSPPSGDTNFGSPNPEATISAIIYNHVSGKLSWQLQVGLSSFSDPQAQGGSQFESVNPDFLITYSFMDKISTYLEFYGQTKTSSTQSMGLIGGVGLIYLYKSKTTFDIEFYQHLTGEFQGFKHFFGFGMSRLFF